MTKPKLIFIGGSLATGKTTMAKAIVEAIGAQYISMDRIKENLFDVMGTFDRAWSKEVGRVAWPVFQNFIDLYLGRGESVVAEATFLWPDDKDWLQEICKKRGADLVQIWLTADPDVLRGRFVERANNGRHCGHCDELPEVLEEFETRFFNKTFIPHPIDAPTLVVDTTDFSHVNHDEVVRFITGV